ncbi:hypothetical protein V9L05_00320 [Bernardetia sp. Wsw4-3y2]|uniref:hypothetical protein n=1 Tax=Bernardetia sp. Wsw4-3y2 TaxID=3127471 RepID=UPI0030D0B8BD
MNIHKINSHLHHSFLEEERKDGITGDLIQANDEVVFCGVCKSSFQKDSWEYMDRKHCGQTKTLNSVPVSKPLLLNVSIIQPYFITLTNSLVSFENCLEMLSDFNPIDKKIEIRLDPVFKKGTEQYIDLLEKIKEPTEGELQVQETETEQGWLSNVMIFIIITIIISVIVGLFAIPFLDTVSSKLIFFSCTALMAYIFVFSNTKYSLKKPVKKEKYQFPIRNVDVLESEESVTFGIFNHNLFLYFESIQQGVFIELARVSEIEIHYQSSCYVHLVLKKQDKTHKEVSIPLLFSKKERITAFLLRLAKTKKDISNQAKIKLVDFPERRVRLLKKKLRFYTDFIFPVKIEKKQGTKTEKYILRQVDGQKRAKTARVKEFLEDTTRYKNRNQHHQNRHQTQYKNYKRR